MQVRNPPQSSSYSVEGCRAGRTGTDRSRTASEYQSDDRLGWDTRVEHPSQPSAESYEGCGVGQTRAERSQGKLTNRRSSVHDGLNNSRQSGWDMRVQYPPQPSVTGHEGCRVGLTGVELSRTDSNSSWPCRGDMAGYNRVFGGEKRGQRPPVYFPPGNLEYARSGTNGRSTGPSDYQYQGN